MKRTYIVLQIAANVAIIILTVLATVVFFMQYVFFSIPPTFQNQVPLADSTRDAQTSNGKVLPIQRTNWAESRKTLVLYLSTTCRFCKDSSPFYQRLVDKVRQDRNISVIAVFPQDEASAREYLKREGIFIDNVYNYSLDSIGVRGTPTLLLLDESGTILNSWVGKLSAPKEAEVISISMG